MDVKFTEAKQCFQCNATFGMFKRRHHCRKCGNSFCGDCQKKTMVMSNEPARVRVCDKCVDALSSNTAEQSQQRPVVQPAQEEPEVEPEPQFEQPKVIQCKCGMPLCLCSTETEKPVAKPKAPNQKNAQLRKPVSVPKQTSPSYFADEEPEFHFSGNTSTMNDECRSAVKDGNYSAVSKFLELGASVKYVDKQGNTFLHLACLFNYSNIVMLLLKAGADPNALNQNKESAIDIAQPALSYRLKQHIVQ